MEKKILIPIFILLILAFSINATIVKQTLKPGESVVIKDKNITLLDSTKDSVKICVNGIKDIVSEDRTKTVNRVAINVKEARTNESKLELTYSCSNCVCDKSCDNTICFNECETDQDCNDYNKNTIDTCKGTPKKCFNEETVECKENIDCDDNNDCTQDICLNNKCLNQNICKEVLPTGQIVKELEPEKPDLLIITNIVLLIIISGIIILILINKLKK